MLSITFMLIISFFLFLPISSEVTILSSRDLSNGYVREDDLCFPIDRHRAYIELNERAKLLVHDIPDPALSNGTGHCLMEIVTCPSCIIEIKVLSLAHSAVCGAVHLSVLEGSNVPKAFWCNHIGTKGNEDSFEYRSDSRTINLSLTYTKNLTGKLFVLEYTAFRNRIEIFGDSHGQSGLITSPIFPMPYPRDLTSEWIFTCRILRECRVRIIFRDFQLETASILEILDIMGKRLDVFGGEVYRPPVLLSNGPGIQIRFHANGASGKGFIAEYYFVSNSESAVVSDCGGFVENTGGTITMMDMISTNSSKKEFDCLWLIRPIRSYNHPKTHLYLKVATFQEMVNPSQVQVIEGLVSTGPLLETVHTNDVEGISHIVPAHLGLYVRLQGTFTATSRIAIIYTAFNYANCYAPVVYLCHNHRCIGTHLVCDGFDHCGDASDELPSCSREWDNSRHESPWHSNSPNYYFPKLERYPDLKTAALAFLGASLGLLLVISALLIFLYRLGARSRHQRQLRSHLQTISELLENARAEETSGGISSLVVPEQPPPLYEPPPEYDQIIKVDIPPIFRNGDESEISCGSQNENNQTRKIRRNRQGSKLTRSRYRPEENSTNSSTRSPPPAYSDLLSSSQQT